MRLVEEEGWHTFIAEEGEYVEVLHDGDSGRVEIVLKEDPRGILTNTP